MASPRLQSLSPSSKVRSPSSSRYHDHVAFLVTLRPVGPQRGCPRGSQAGGPRRSPIPPSTLQPVTDLPPRAMTSETHEVSASDANIATGIFIG